MSRYVATGGSVSLLMLTRLVQVRWLLGFHPYRWSILKPLVGGSVAAGAARLAASASGDLPGYIPLAAGVLAFTVTYVGMILAMGFDQYDRYVLARIRGRLTGMRS